MRMMLFEFLEEVGKRMEEKSVLPPCDGDVSIIAMSCVCVCERMRYNWMEKKSRHDDNQNHNETNRSMLQLHLIHV